MQNINVVCINWGDKYPVNYVTYLYNMIKRHRSQPFEFYCLTDNIHHYQKPIIPIKLLSGYQGWWNKMQLFKDDILPIGEYLYCDLDIVIVDNIDCIFQHQGFGIIRDFVNPDHNILGGKEYNSSVMRFTQNMALWHFFQKNISRWQKIQKKIPFFGDQNVIGSFLNQQNYSNAFPDEWIWSFKVGVSRGKHDIKSNIWLGKEIPKHGKICVFHGNPKPSDVDIAWVTQHWC